MENSRVYLLPNKPAFKANLHCHSTFSDGVFTPEELKTMYQERGYSILGYTDHEVIFPHEDLNDDQFLALPGYEFQTYGDMELPKLMRRVSHMNLYPRDKDNRVQPFFNIADILRLDVQPDFSQAQYLGDGYDEKEYSARGLNALIAKAKAAGYIVMYNHPTWSREDASVYTNLEGLFAVEIYNHGTYVDGADSYCPYVYDEMLRSGQRIGCVASDDTHEAQDLFGGFTMVYAQELTHRMVIAALEKGDFYASRGPVIQALWYEEGVFHIECTPAKSIVISNSGRRKGDKSVVRLEDGFVTSADFPLDDNDLYVRFTVTDELGRTANTRGYWREEFETSPAAIPNICNRKIGI